MSNYTSQNSYPELLVNQTLLDTIIQAFTMSVIMFMAIVFNALVLVCFYRHRALQTYTNAFVVNLACTDFCFGLIGMPMTLVTSITIDWRFGESLCKFHGFVLILFSKASIWTLTFVSFERYFSIKYPFFHQRWITPSVVSASIAFVWLISTVFALLPFFISRFTFHRFNHICVADWRLSLQTTLVYCIFSIFVPLTLMGCYNVGILRTAWQQNQKVDVKVGNIRKMTIRSCDAGALVDELRLEAERRAAEKVRLRKRRELRATVLVLAIVGGFFICWVHYAVTTMCLTIKGYRCRWPSQLLVASAWLTNLSSGLNPILYIVFNVAIRRAIKQLLGIGRRGSLEGSYCRIVVTTVNCI